jgi:hypothetical protein
MDALEMVLRCGITALLRTLIDPILPAGLFRGLPAVLARGGNLGDSHNERDQRLRPRRKAPILQP